MIGGFFIGNSDLIALAKGILRLHLPKMINKNGYLEESSSHYQLLLTRSLIEISLISEILLDQDFFDWVNDYTQRMFLASSRLEPKEDN